jgi:hypothetical protein
VHGGEPTVVSAYKSGVAIHTECLNQYTGARPIVLSELSPIGDNGRCPHGALRAHRRRAGAPRPRPCKLLPPGAAGEEQEERLNQSEIFRSKPTRCLVSPCGPALGMMSSAVPGTSESQDTCFSAARLPNKAHQQSKKGRASHRTSESHSLRITRGTHPDWTQHRIGSNSTTE